MLRRPNAWVALVLLFGGNLLFALPPEPAGDHDPTSDSTLAQNPMPPDKKVQPVGPPAPAKKIDIRYPADAVLIVTEQAADVLKALPKYVILSPEKHQEYVDEIARLKAQLEMR